MIHDPALAHMVHYVFEWASLALGAWVYRRQPRLIPQQPLTQGPAFFLLLGCLLGAAVGNKALYWVEYPHLLAQAWHSPQLWLQGQSVVGGLLGGWWGVEATKALIGWQGPRTGDAFVPAILAGLVLGRIGCALAGVHDGTAGLPTTLPWGLDQGDRVPRHPTALYEAALCGAGLATWSTWRVPLAATPGLAFRVFMLGYLTWRLLIDLLKPVPYAYSLGLSGIQWACAGGLLFITLGLWRDRAASTVIRKIS